MTKNILYVGLDAHKNTIDVALAGSGAEGEIRSYGKIISNMEALNKLIRKIKTKGSALQFVCEAGPCGYEVCRYLVSKGHTSSVVAPSMVPRRSGERIKTDRRDAINLVRLFRAGEPTSIYIPTKEDEAIRDLSRCRDDMRRLQRKVRQRLLVFLLRHGFRYSGTKNWTKTHMNWLAGVKMPHPAQQVVLQEYIDAANECTDRLQRITEQIRAMVSEWSRAPFVWAYQALRGVSLIVATAVVAEIGDMSRFKDPKELMAYLGLVPSEHSSGNSVHRGAITRTGNGHVRRVLIGAAWTYKTPAKKTVPILTRQQGLSKSICEISRKNIFQAACRGVTTGRRILAAG